MNANDLDIISRALNCEPNLDSAAREILRREACEPGSWLPWNASDVRDWFQQDVTPEVVEELRIEVEEVSRG